MNLYEINSALQAAVDDCIDPETGEILNLSLIQSGQDVPGAEIVTGQSIQIR